MTTQRFLYHSFPRINKCEDSYKLGESILENIIDYGIILTPEHITWKNHWPNEGQNYNFTYIQQRACFTELRRAELREHTKNFGNYSLELKIESARDLGAIPVSYIPVPSSSKNLSDIGVKMIHNLGEINRILELLSEIDELEDDAAEAKLVFNRNELDLTIKAAKSFVKTLFQNRTNPQNLLGFMLAFLSQFYPTENLDYNSFLTYYKQREWRICGNINHYRGKVVKDLPGELKSKLLSQSGEFFEKRIQFNGHWPIIDRTKVHNGFDFSGQDFFSFVNRVYCPDERIHHVKEILNRKNRIIDVQPYC